MNSIELLDRATSTGRTLGDLARSIGLKDGALRKAKHDGRLSPGVAAALAAELGEDPARWTLAAVAESERSAPLRERINKALRTLPT